MTGVKLVVAIIVLAILVVGGHDAYEISRANNDVRNTARSAADSAAAVLTQTHGADAVGARKAANQVAAQASDVVTHYNLDPVNQKVTLTIGGTASSWVAGRIERSWTDNITATASATAKASPSA
jgi:Flp pilus assembly protein TadG